MAYFPEGLLRPPPALLHLPIHPRHQRYTTICYIIDQLISWRKHAWPLDQVVCRRVRAAFSRRGCRAGRKKHRTVSSDVDTGHIPVISVVRPATPPSPSSSSRSPRHTAVLTTVHQQRHDITSNRCTQFGCLNIRSLNNKLDDVLEVSQTRSVH